MTELRCQSAESFSLARGGPLHRFLVRIGWKETERERVIQRTGLGVALTWLPMLLFALAQGVAFGPRVDIAFLHDFSVNLRFLVALPILILAESTIDRR
jgi:hypothetical protein